MSERDLTRFGKKLRQLRQESGFSQEELAERLSLVHAHLKPEDDLRVDGNRISKWERAFKTGEGREWRPQRQQLLYLIELFAHQLTLERAQVWAEQAGYKLNPSELQRFFLPGSNLGATPPFSNFKPIRLPPSQLLFGVQEQQQQLYRRLAQQGPPWLISISGIGGIGKTSLASNLVHEIIKTGRFRDVAWITAKQEELLLGIGLQPLNRPAIDTSILVDTLLEQLDQTLSHSLSADEKLARLTDLLKNQPCLVVIDNLETLVDYQFLLPSLHRWANPSKFLLTSRHTLHFHSDVFCLNLQEINQAETIAFINYEAQLRGLMPLVEATPAQLELIYQVVGGNPLALRLVIGQVAALPLSSVLEGLKQAQGKKVEALYTYIYWQAWHALDPKSQQLLLVMPLTQKGSLDQLLSLSKLKLAELDQALEQLVQLSLIQVEGELEARRYSIHRLTETFLLQEVIKWRLST